MTYKRDRSTKKIRIPTIFLIDLEKTSLKKSGVILCFAAYFNLMERENEKFGPKKGFRHEALCQALPGPGRVAVPNQRDDRVPGAR
jgi:hypothetical protein